VTRRLLFLYLAAYWERTGLGRFGQRQDGMHMRLTLTAAVAAAFSALSLPAQADITIGVINSLSGNFATFGERYRTGMQVALDEINASGGIKGQKITLSVHDDRSEAQSALAAGEKLASQQDVPLVIGSYASSITGPLAQYMTRRETPLIVLGSADDSITKPGSPWAFRAKHNSTIVAKAYFDYFDYLKKENAGAPMQSIAMLYGNGAWPSSLAKEGKRLAAERGYKIVGDQAYDQGVTDFRPILNRFRGANPDILYIVSYADDGVAIARQMREVGLNAKAIAIDTSAALPSFVNQVGDLANYVATAVSWSKDVKYPGAQDLYQRLKATGSEPSFYEAEGYLALIVAADALRRAVSLDRKAVREALEKTDFTNAVTSVSFPDQNGFQNQNPIRSLILQIQKGDHVTVFPPDIAAAKPMHPTPDWSAR
jgi:branched-chain amino acid transport system substrate-binding protein